LSFDTLWVHVTVTAALSGAVANVLFLIRDLDDAFAGDWQVDNSAYKRALDSFGA
jgi:hypothetical protein